MALISGSRYSKRRAARWFGTGVALLVVAAASVGASEVRTVDRAVTGEGVGVVLIDSGVARVDGLLTPGRVVTGGRSWSGRSWS